LTDVEGVLDQDKKLISKLVRARGARPDRRRHDFRRHDSQDPDRDRCVEGGVNAAVILDGRIPHVLLLELFTEHGAGTLITAE
jgi:acetylglutamate kinase